MPSLHILSVLVFSALFFSSFRLFIKVKDNELGYEETMTFISMVLSLINIIICFVFDTQTLSSNIDLIRSIFIGSMLFQSLLITSTLKYVNDQHVHRIKHKKENHANSRNN